MHYFLLLCIVVPLVWGSVSIIPIFVQTYDVFPGLTAALLLVFLCTSLWGIATAYLIDLLSSHNRRNNEFLRNFYKLLYEDLGVMLVLAALLWGIFWAAKPAYSLSNIDIACLGLPLYIYAISSIARATDPSGILNHTWSQSFSDRASVGPSAGLLHRARADLFWASSSARLTLEPVEHPGRWILYVRQF
ncbi:hypothetical protein CWM66_27995 [Kosakonia sp. H7A]|nr:hypothetical protein CWM66_27995 [Kosakonia sp. H7A]